MLYGTAVLSIEEGSAVVPSMVSLDDATGRLLVGRVARNRLAAFPHHTIVRLSTLGNMQKSGRASCGRPFGIHALKAFQPETMAHARAGQLEAEMDSAEFEEKLIFLGTLPRKLREKSRSAHDPLDMIFDELEEDEEEIEKLFGAVPQSVAKAKHPKTPERPAQR